MVLVESYDHGCQGFNKCQGSISQGSCLSLKRHSWQHGTTSLQDQSKRLERLNSNSLSPSMPIPARPRLQINAKPPKNKHLTKKQHLTLLLIISHPPIPISAIITKKHLNNSNPMLLLKTITRQILIIMDKSINKIKTI